MTALGGAAASAAFARSSRLAGAPLVRAALITLMLGCAIGARWGAAVGDLADGTVVGAAFGTILLVGVALAGWRPRLIPVRPLAWAGGIGLGGGAALLALALATRWPGPWLPFHPAASFAPWVAVTVLVATAEEIVLRGALFDALDEASGAEASGAIAALVGTSIAFALLHVPLYGWHVVPLDLGVGLFLGGLRLLTGGVAAPAVVHVVADLATWWI
jgi:membrane protease YdiL (CAAX protease family)